MCEIDSLPNECLEQIFIHLPLATFISVVPLVSRRWAAVRNASARLRNRLELMFLDLGAAPFEYYLPKPFQMMIHKPLTIGMVLSFVALFPAIRHLHIWLPYPMRNLAAMILSWNRTIIDLSIIISNSDGIVRRQSINNPLLDVINTSLPRLRYLTFYHENCTYYNNNLRLELPVLLQLSRFSFFTNNSIEELFDSLRRYACRNDRLQSIQIFNRITPA